MKNLIILLLFLAASLSAYAASYSQPESVVYDAVRNCYYVSNVGVQGVFDGSIIIRKSDGTLENLLSDNLFDPKGMYIVGDTLFVTDVYRVHYISLSSRQLLGTTIVSTPNIFLNDIAADDKGYIYLSETAGGFIYRMNAGNPNQFQQINLQGSLSSPNGLCFDKENNRLLIVTFHSNANIHALDLETMELTLLKTTDKQYFDGITRDKAGNYLVSEWGPIPMTPGIGKIYKFDKNFISEPTLFASNFDGPADIFMDTINNVLAIPNMGTNIVQFLNFGETLNKPILEYPLNNSYGLGVNIPLRWLEVAGAENYTVQLSKNNEFSPLDLNETVVGLEYVLNNLAPSTTFYWRVRANGMPESSSWSDVWTFSTTNVSYEAPTLVLPENGEQYAARKPKFVWNKTKAGLYHFQMWSNPMLLGDPVVEINSLMDTAVAFSNDLPLNQTYYWRVKTFSGYVQSEWSELWSFRVAEFTYPQPELISPTNNETSVEPYTSFKWRSHEAGNYRLQISLFNNFSENFFDKVDLKDTVYTLDFPLQTNVRFYWRVRAYDEKAGTWSSVYSFETNTFSSVSDNVNSFELYPNPAKDIIQIESVEEVFNYQILSLSGNKVLCNDVGGKKNISINISEISSGTYIIVLNNRIIKQFVITR